MFDPDDPTTDVETRARVPTNVPHASANVGSDSTEKPRNFRRIRCCATVEMELCRPSSMLSRHRSWSTARASFSAPWPRDAWRGPCYSLRAIMGPAACPEGASRAIARDWRFAKKMTRRNLYLFRHLSGSDIAVNCVKRNFLSFKTHKEHLLC